MVPTLLTIFLSGPEVLVAGPIPWGTDLQLPDSWVRTITTATVPEDQPLHTPLEVSRARQGERMGHGVKGDLATREQCWPTATAAHWCSSVAESALLCL